ncbi:MATE family efflux transporter [Paenibacillus sp. GYB003]|uniref:MATE family efflux transporter n=1 Tax=Paenibacillus sp. GYB003 TaxID=2994392 RepID=UPI002F96548B
MPGIALGGALTAMAAQNIGAGKWERVNRAALAGIGINLLLTGVLVLICILFRDEILSLFLPAKGNALEIGKQIILITFWSYILFGISLVIARLFFRKELRIERVMVELPDFSCLFGYPFCRLLPIGKMEKKYERECRQGCLYKLIVTWI